MIFLQRQKRKNVFNIKLNIKCWHFERSVIFTLQGTLPFNSLRNKNNRVFSNGLGNLGSIPGQVIPKTQKMVLDATLLNTQLNKVRIKGKVEQSREKE